jgi:predicted nicotinamide N-methyase
LANDEQKRLTCLELGAGTGTVSLCLLAAGVVDRALLTDIPALVPQLETNVAHNSSVIEPGHALVLPLSWAHAADVASSMKGPDGMQLQPPFRLIVGSDLIYYR